MTLAEFENNDRYVVIDDMDIVCHGGTGHRSKQACQAAAWMLDPENGDGFDAVLDLYDMQVATLEDVYIVWTPLDEFEG